MISIAQPLIGKKEKEAVINVLESGNLAYNRKCKIFEQKFAKFCGVRYGVSTNSGTAGLHLALLAMDIKRGNEVITTPFSFIATANAILYVGAKPVFADIDKRTFNIDPQSIIKKITKKTRAIVVVHLYGQSCEMRTIKKIAKKYRLLILEDAAQAHGAEYNGKKVGSFGDVAVFSFYATKNMTTGEGGMIVTNSKKIAETARILCDQGQTKKYYFELLGYNYRMTEIAAVIGLQQLRKIEKINQKRIKNANYLTQKIKEKNIPVIPPYQCEKTKHVYHQYTIQCENRDEVRDYLKKNGIITGVYYPIPINSQPVYRSLGYNSKETPRARIAAKRVLSLPIHPFLQKRDLDFIVEKLTKFFI